MKEGTNIRKGQGQGKKVKDTERHIKARKKEIKEKVKDKIFFY